MPAMRPTRSVVERGQRRVPRHVPAHEVAVADALVVRALAEDRVGDVAGMEVGQLRDLGGDPRAAFALLGRGPAVVPHVVVGDELSAPFERVEQGRPVRPARRAGGGVDLDHGQAPPGGGDRVAFPGVCAFSRFRSCSNSVSKAARSAGGGRCTSCSASSGATAAVVETRAEPRAREHQRDQQRLRELLDGTPPTWASTITARTRDRMAWRSRAARHRGGGRRRWARRARSTTGTARPAGSPRASPPTSPADRAR